MFKNKFKLNLSMQMKEIILKSLKGVSDPELKENNNLFIKFYKIFRRNW